MHRKELEKQLLELPTTYIVAFAVRVALQCLPYLVTNRNKPSEYFFAYWETKEQPKNIFSVLDTY